MTQYNFLSECSDIDQSKFQTENWYLMGWGMGDGINATLFLESQSPVPYKILCPPRNLNGIKFILDIMLVVSTWPCTKCPEIRSPYFNDFSRSKSLTKAVIIPASKASPHPVVSTTSISNAEVFIEMVP